MLKAVVKGPLSGRFSINIDCAKKLKVLIKNAECKKNHNDFWTFVMILYYFSKVIGRKRYKLLPENNNYAFVPVGDKKKVRNQYYFILKYFKISLYVFDKKCIFEWRTHSKGIFFIWNQIWFKFFIIVLVSGEQHRPGEWVALNWILSKNWFQKNFLTVMDNKIAFTGVVHVNVIFETKQSWIISCFLTEIVPWNPNWSFSWHNILFEIIWFEPDHQPQTIL
jgi:hypothetical protein